MSAQTATPRVVATLAELVAGASGRTTVRPGDARSGAIFERVEVDGQPYFCKRVSYASDWIMRVTMDRDYRTFQLWQSGLMHRVPACIDHAVVAMALEGSGPEAVLGILMRDVGDRLVPEGDEAVPLDQHLAFLDHMAALSAAFWG